jgi:hypothetical protein
LKDKPSECFHQLSTIYAFRNGRIVKKRSAGGVLSMAEAFYRRKLHEDAGCTGGQVRLPAAD